VTVADSTGPLPQLYPDVPGAPRVETLQRRFPPARPFAPSAADCTEEDLLELAAGAARDGNELYALLASRDHVRRICALLVEYAPEGASLLATRARQLAAAQGVADTLRTRLAAVRAALGQATDEHRETIRRAEQERELRVAAEAERDRLAQHARDNELLASLSASQRAWEQVSAENVHLRHQVAGTTPASVQVALERADPTVDGRFDDADTQVVDDELLQSGAAL
jgi:hypothetical protein